MLPPALFVDSVSRVFASSSGERIQALSDVTFTVARGESVALLGRNGAGKSTLAKIIATLLLPTTGTVQVAGYNVVRESRAARSSMSVVFGGDRGLYGLLSAEENLRYFALLGGVRTADVRRRLDPLLEQVGLAEHKHRRVEEFSKGMRQRLHIAIALIADPQFLVLDEPTVGLDPIEAERLRSNIAELRQRDVAVLLTSHVLLDVDRLSERVLMIDRGTMTHDLSVSEFARATGYAATVTISVRTRPSEAMVALWRQSGLTSVEVVPDGAILEFRVHRWDASTLKRLGDLASQFSISDLDVRMSTLDDAFAILAADGVVANG